jgi:hypothetical protein
MRKNIRTTIALSYRQEIQQRLNLIKIMVALEKYSSMGTATVSNSK